MHSHTHKTYGVCPKTITVTIDQDAIINIELAGRSCTGNLKASCEAAVGRRPQDVRLAIDEVARTRRFASVCSASCPKQLIRAVEEAVAHGETSVNGQSQTAE